METFPQLCSAHIQWLEVDVKQRAAIPLKVMCQTTFIRKTIIERSTRERRGICNLHVKRRNISYKIVNLVKDVGRMFIKAHDKACGDTNAICLDTSDGLFMVVSPSKFPVASCFDTIET